MSGLSYDDSAKPPSDLEKSGFKDDVQIFDVAAGATTHNAHVVGTEGHLKRRLKNRHIQMISIGVRTDLAHRAEKCRESSALVCHDESPWIADAQGLFLGIGNSLRKGGPLGLLLGYSIIGSAVFTVMIALGEMISHVVRLVAPVRTH